MMVEAGGTGEGLQFPQIGVIDRQLLEKLPVYNMPLKREFVVEAYFNGAWERALEKGSVSERNIEVLGLYAFTDMTLEELGGQFGWSGRERAKQVVHRTLQVLFDHCTKEFQGDWQERFDEANAVRQAGMGRMMRRVHGRLQAGAGIEDIQQELGLGGRDLKELRERLVQRGIDLPLSPEETTLWNHRKYEQMYNVLCADSSSVEEIVEILDQVDLAYYKWQRDRYENGEVEGRSLIPVSELAELRVPLRKVPSMVASLKRSHVPTATFLQGEFERRQHVVAAVHEDWARQALDKDPSLDLRKKLVLLFSDAEWEGNLPIASELLHAGDYTSVTEVLKQIGIRVRGGRKPREFSPRDLFGKNSGCLVPVFLYSGCGYRVHKSNAEGLVQFVLGRVEQLKKQRENSSDDTEDWTK